MNSKAILLIGSPKGGASASKALGTYLTEELEKKGFQCESVRILTALKSNDSTNKLLNELNDVDLVILAFPVYVDSLPAPVIRMMEIIAGSRKTVQSKKNQKFIAITNCGFPETVHCETALEICQSFARSAGFEWSGGLALGGGGILDGSPIKDAGGKARNIRLSLDLTAESLSELKPISAEAIELMSKPVVPYWLYRFFGDIGWIVQSFKYKVFGKLKDRPYEKRH
jgi:hypothetical protein